MKNSIRMPGAAGASCGTQSTLRMDQNVGQAAKPSASGLAFNFETDQSSKEAVCRRTTFFVNADWQFCSSLQAAKCVVGQMYVESIEPMITTQEYPIVLIHGDFHTGQIWLTKPDGNPGWASFFVNKGYCVYTLDLPPCGRSNFLTGNHLRYRDIAQQAHSLEASFVERELTAPEKQPVIEDDKVGWARARLHDKWPGTGQRGDKIFTKYCASLTTLTLKKAERETLAQNALRELLKVTGKAILVGEGSGSTMAWLAADVEPDLVAAVVAVEPTGPPFGVAFTRKPAGRNYTPFIQYDGSCRKYGLSDIPLTYDPPVPITIDAATSDASAMDVYMFERPDKRGCCLLQRPIENKINITKEDPVRQLVQLKKMPHAIITGQASSHTAYDWATLYFMRQAGVNADWIKLEDFNILGNGHLMFLETNSNDVASVIDLWIKQHHNRSGSGCTPKAEAATTLSKAAVPHSKGKGRAVSSDEGSMHGTRVIRAMPPAHIEPLPSTPRGAKSRALDAMRRAMSPDEDSDECEEIEPQPDDFAFNAAGSGQIAVDCETTSSSKRANPEVLSENIQSVVEGNSRGQARKRQQLDLNVTETGSEPSDQASPFPPSAFHNGNSMLMNLDGLDPFFSMPSINTSHMSTRHKGEHQSPMEMSNVTSAMQQSFKQPLQLSPWAHHINAQASQAFNLSSAMTDMNSLPNGQMGFGTGNLAYSPTGTLRFESPPTGWFSLGQPSQGTAQAQEAFSSADWVNNYNLAAPTTVPQVGHGYQLQNLTGGAGTIQSQQPADMAAQQQLQTVSNNEAHDAVEVSTPRHPEEALYPSPESLEEALLSGGSGSTFGTLPIAAPSSPTPAPRGAIQNYSTETQMFSDFLAEPIDEILLKFE